MESIAMAIVLVAELYQTPVVLEGTPALTFADPPPHLETSLGFGAPGVPLTKKTVFKVSFLKAVSGVCRHHVLILRFPFKACVLA
jgi:hypothetical protein